MIPIPVILSLDSMEKAAQKRFFQELVPKLARITGSTFLQLNLDIIIIRTDNYVWI